MAYAQIISGFRLLSFCTPGFGWFQQDWIFPLLVTRWAAPQAQHVFCRLKFLSNTSCFDLATLQVFKVNQKSNKEST